MPEKRRVNEHLYCINCVSKILPKYGKNVRKSMLILLKSLKRQGDAREFSFRCVQVFVEYSHLSICFKYHNMYHAILNKYRNVSYMIP